jgi:hypothetical protein
MKNSYDISEDGATVTIWLKRKNGDRLACLIDAADLPKADSIPCVWHAHWSKETRGFYVYGSGSVAAGRERKCIKLHRFITDAPDGFDVDHWNHDTLDNRRENLKVTTRSGNLMNRRGAQRNSTTGHRGISPDRRSGKFRLVLTVNGKHQCVGYFATIDEAIAVRNQYPGYGKKLLRHSEESR